MARGFRQRSDVVQQLLGETRRERARRWWRSQAQYAGLHSWPVSRGLFLVAVAGIVCLAAGWRVGWQTTYEIAVGIASPASVGSSSRPNAYWQRTCAGRTCSGRSCAGRTCAGRSCAGRACSGRSCAGRACSGRRGRRTRCGRMTQFGFGCGKNPICRLMDRGGCATGRGPKTETKPAPPHRSAEARARHWQGPVSQGVGIPWRWPALVPASGLSGRILAGDCRNGHLAAVAAGHGP
jgi:hypothetical protein